MLAIFGIDGGALSLITQLLVLFLIVTATCSSTHLHRDQRRAIAAA